jgi:hypothetical protein
MLLVATLVIVAVGIGLLMTAVRWSHQLKELDQYGVETTGTVERKISYHTKGGRSRYIRYAYTDQFGQRHTRKTFVLGDAWEQYQEGGAIPVVYSQRTPRVSAAKYVYDTMSTAVTEKQAKNRGTV